MAKFDDVLKFPAGSVLTLTQGEYSDFCISGQVVTIKEFDLLELGEKFKQEKTGDKWGADPGDFPAWLVVNGYAMPLDHSEVHIGTYGRFDLG